MENTENNKQLFFSIYFKQKVRKIRSIDGTVQKELYLNFELSNIGNDYLELTDLKNISDEDAIELAKFKIDRNNHYGESYFDIYKMTNDNEWIQYIKSFCVNTIHFDEFTVGGWDFLRSKGYALPYMGLSVEQQIEYGWIKLKTE